MIRDVWAGSLHSSALAWRLRRFERPESVPNPTIAALLLLLIVLATVTAARLRVAVAVSIAAMFAFNYFFLPPFYTLTIADPQNWIALFVFLAVAIVASQLSGARAPARIEALNRQRDLERLYAWPVAAAVSKAMRWPPRWPGPLPMRSSCRASRFMTTDGNRVLGGSGRILPPLDDKLRRWRDGGVLSGDGTVMTAVRLGGAPIGSLAIVGGPLNDTVLHSVTNLVAIGLERARGQAAPCGPRRPPEQRAARGGAGRGRPRVQDAADVDEGGGDGTAARHARRRPEARSSSTSSTRISSRLEALISDAVQMLRLDAGDFVVNRERHRVADIAGSVLREFAPTARGPRVDNHVPSELMVDADRALLELALRQLLDNALEVLALGIDDRNARIGNGDGRSRYEIPAPTIPEHERAASSNDSIAARKRGRSPAPAWGSRSSDRSPRRMAAH